MALHTERVQINLCVSTTITKGHGVVHIKVHWEGSFASVTFVVLPRRNLVTLCWRKSQLSSFLHVHKEHGHTHSQKGCWLNVFFWCNIVVGSHGAGVRSMWWCVVVAMWEERGDVCGWPVTVHIFLLSATVWMLVNSVKAWTLFKIFQKIEAFQLPFGANILRQMFEKNGTHQ
jgi:hypothetical protein